MMEYNWFASPQDNDESDEETSEHKKLFFMASALGHINRMEEFLNDGISVETKDYVFGETVFIRACRYNHVDVLRMLHGRGVNVNATSNTGETGLHIAVKNSSIECVEYLLSIPWVDTNFPDKLGQTPLIVAAFKGRVRCVELLLSTQCDVTAQDSQGQSALHRALEPYDNTIGKNNAYLCVQLLTNANCDINLCDGIGYSPLHIAVQNYNWLGVRWLVFENCDLDVKGQNNPQLAIFKQTKTPVIASTAFLLAMNYLNRRIVEFLISSGCIYHQYKGYLTYCEKDVLLYQYLKVMFCTPRTLKASCRTVIRRHLGRDIVSKVQCLKLPEMLKSFTLLHHLKQSS